MGSVDRLTREELKEVRTQSGNSSSQTMSCSTKNTSSDQSWSRREAFELYRMRLHVSACYPKSRPDWTSR